MRAEKNTVRSVQRIYNPKKHNAQWVAKYYPIWLSKRFAGLINPKFDGSFLRFYLMGIMLLELKVIEDRTGVVDILSAKTGPDFQNPTVTPKSRALLR